MVPASLRAAPRLTSYAVEVVCRSRAEILGLMRKPKEGCLMGLVSGGHLRRWSLPSALRKPGISVLIAAPAATMTRDTQQNTLVLRVRAGF